MLSLFIASAALVVGFALLLGAAQPAAADEPKLRLIVSFDGQSSSATRALLRSVGAVERIRYRGIPAVAIDLSESQLAALRASGLVTSVETDARLRTFDHEGGVADPELAASWGVAHIGAGAVHAHPNRGAGVTIAIIDTGIDYTHPELDAHYVGGYDFHNGDADPMDDNQHGTHVAGIAAAEANGGDVVGVAPEASLLAYKVLGADGSGDYSALIAALECARGIPPNGVPQSACPAPTWST